ncbi:MAG: hypothetical protein IIA53_10525, partial [Chloroflexi bacterium]|nr:hypothetical protein [Chloroflexota bacterium]
MADPDLDINKIGGYALAELIKSIPRGAWNAIRNATARVVWLIGWPIRWAWRMTGWEFTRRQSGRTDLNQSGSIVISDNVLWKVTSILTYATAPGKTTLIVDGPLCPAHMSPLWFGIQTDEKLT